MTRKRLGEIKSWHERPAPENCPLCGREIPASQMDAHHLVPKSKGGRQTRHLHRICHRQIHALFTHTELVQHYSTIEALLQHPEMQRFIEWVRKKPPDFIDGARRSRRIRK